MIQQAGCACGFPIVAPSGRRVYIENPQPPVGELADGSPSARVALLVNLVQQPGCSFSACPLPSYLAAAR
jgi:hypothetical protein